jgi:hypothetical protein
MEVLTFFSNNIEFVNQFDKFICNYYNLNLDSQDADTKYFTRKNTNINEIYFHFLLNDVSVEFSYNYTSEEKKKIEDYFGEYEIYSFDIQYRNEKFLEVLLNDFRCFLTELNNARKLKLIIHHTRMGLIFFLNINKNE